MTTLILRPSGLPERVNRPWSLQLRDHDLGGTHYETLCRVDDDTAWAIVDAGAPGWLFVQPDRKARDDARDLECARVLREQADDIERAVLGLPRPEREIAFEHARGLGIVPGEDTLTHPVVLSLAREVGRLEAELAAATKKETADDV